MDVVVVHALVDAVAAIDEQTASRDTISAATGQVRRLRAWVQAQEIRLAQGMARVASYPEQAIAEAGRVDLNAAARLVKRADTAARAPAVADAVDAGQLSGEHVDALTRTLNSVEPKLHDRLIKRAEELVPAASLQTPEQYAKRLRAEANQLCDDDGVARLERQRRASRLRTWTDQVTGMWNIRGEFDPVTALTLAAIIDAALAQQYAEPTPITCPSDPVEKQHHLRALALVRLLAGGGTKVTVPEAIVVLHADANGEVVIDTGRGVDIPRRHLDDMVRRAKICPVVIRDGEVIWAPGEMNHGRNRRLATHDQRNALRAMYRTCVIPDCAVPFDHTRIHHITEYGHGGRSDLCELVPFCAKHHSRLHADQWVLSMGRGRVLIITLPDGTELRCPPNRAGP